jgi:hypothetical protein
MQQLMHRIILFRVSFPEIKEYFLVSQPSTILQHPLESGLWVVYIICMTNPEPIHILTISSFTYSAWRKYAAMSKASFKMYRQLMVTQSKSCNNVTCTSSEMLHVLAQKKVPVSRCHLVSQMPSYFCQQGISSHLLYNLFAGQEELCTFFNSYARKCVPLE